MSLPKWAIEGFDHTKGQNCFTIKRCYDCKLIEALSIALEALEEIREAGSRTPKWSIASMALRRIEEIGK